MAYMNADTANKVGFRPYGATNPQCATQLSGWRDEQGHNPFLPTAWHLHGLGDYEFNRPFDPWELYERSHPGMHGLGDIGDVSDATSNAADELYLNGSITLAQHDAITNGSMSFTDAIGIDPTDQNSWSGFTGMLQDWNSALKTLEAQYQAAGPQAGNQAFIQLGQQIVQQRSQYNSITPQFVQFYTMMMGSTPPGLSGLGIAPVVIWVAGAAVFLVTAYFAYQAFKTWQASINVQTIVAQTASAAQASNTSTNANLMTALAAAQAKGDTVTANAILATLQKTAVPSSGSPMTALETWLTGNAMWLALGAGALIVLPNLFSGGRRR
jgi:hypothetical protein